MIRRLPALLLSLALSVAPLGASAASKGAASAWKAGDTVTVKREGARLMVAARFFGKACGAAVSPGQKVKILERQRGWARIAAPGGGRCWLHESAWSDREAGELARTTPGASQRDVELAGRGFSEAEESRYRGEHRELDAAFAALEAHLRRAPEPAPDELERFIGEGQLPFSRGDAGGRL